MFLQIVISGFFWPIYFSVMKISEISKKADIKIDIVTIIILSISLSIVFLKFTDRAKQNGAHMKAKNYPNFYQ